MAEPKLNPMNIYASYFFFVLIIPSLLGLAKQISLMNKKREHAKTVELLSLYYRRMLLDEEWPLEDYAKKFKLSEQQARKKIELFCKSCDKIAR